MDQTKTTFQTKWGTYSYRKMPFRLINAKYTFQRDMDIALRGLINKSVVVYPYDVTPFSKKRGDHLSNLQQIFKRCCRYKILLNPKKSVFTMIEGKILGYIISKDGIIIDPKRINSITNIAFLNNKKTMKSFLGKINFVCRFIFGFVEIIKLLQ